MPTSDTNSTQLIKRTLTGGTSVLNASLFVLTVCMAISCKSRNVDIKTNYRLQKYKMPLVLSVCYCISGIRFSPRMERRLWLKKYDVKFIPNVWFMRQVKLSSRLYSWCACMGCSQNGKKDPEYRDWRCRLDMVNPIAQKSEQNHSQCKILKY
jgi:hypothetical protein